MKRILCLALTLTILFSLAACGNQAENVQTPSASVGQDAGAKNNASGAGMDDALSSYESGKNSETSPASAPSPSVDETNTPVDEANPSVPAKGEGEDVDPSKTGEPLDLTLLSSTMVYAEVNNIMMTPENYIGRQITMEGLFYSDQGYDENWEIDPDIMYFGCIIEDATACCALGVEFVLADETAVFPDDYPAEGSEIIVTGEFQAYTEGDYTFYHLTNATMSAKEA